MTHQVGKKWVMSALTGAALVMGSFTTLNAQAGVCVLDFANVEPAVSYDGYPNYFNSGSSHEHSITDKWNSVVVRRFLSCYQRWLKWKKVPVSQENCKAAYKTTRHIWYPLPDGQDAEVTSAHWFEDAKSCAQLKALGILPQEVKLLASFGDESLEASVNGNKVDLTLKTLSEEDVLSLLILRVKADDNGLLQVQPVCSWGSNGNKVSGASYDCTDENGSAGSVYMPASVDGKGEYTLYLDKKVTAE